MILFILFDINSRIQQLVSLYESNHQEKYQTLFKQSLGLQFVKSDSYFSFYISKQLELKIVLFQFQQLPQEVIKCENIEYNLIKTPQFDMFSIQEHQLQERIKILVEQYSKNSNSQKIISLSQIKQILMKNQQSFSNQIHTILSEFFINTLKERPQAQQQKLFLNVFAHFIKIYLSCEQFDKINENIINLLQQQQDFLIISLQLLTEILEVMQENPPCKYERFLINHTLNNYLTLANILLDRSVIKDDSQESNTFEIVVSDECVLSLVKLINSICRYDFQSTMRGQQSDQYIWERSPIIIPTKYSRYSKFQQFQTWIRKDNLIILYQQLYYGCRSNEVKMAIIDLLGDLSRIHFRFFKTRNNYKIYIGNIVYVYIQILSELTLEQEQNYLLSINLIKNIYKLFTSNMLFQLDEDLRQKFYEIMTKFILFQILDKLLICQSMIEYLNFMTIAWEKAKYESSQRFGQQLMYFLKEIEKKYESLLIEDIKTHKTNYMINNTFWQCFQDSNEEGLKQFLIIFRRCRPNCYLTSPICLLIQFQYNFCTYLEYSQRDHRKQKATKAIIQIFNSLSQLSEETNQKKIIFSYIMLELERCPIHLSGFFKQTKINLAEILCFLLQTKDEKYIMLILNVVKRANQTLMQNPSQLNKMKDNILHVIDHTNYLGENIVKMYQIYGYLIDEKDISEQSLSYVLIQAIVENYRSDKYNCKLMYLYEIVKNIILKGYLTKQNILNHQYKDIHLLKSIEIILILQNNLPSMEKYAFAKTFAIIIKQATITIFLKLNSYDTDTFLQSAAILINCCKLLLLYMYDAKYILKQHKDLNLSALIEASIKILKSTKKSYVLLYEQFSQNLIEFIKTTFYYYLEQIFQQCINEIYEVWYKKKQEFSFIAQLFSKDLSTLKDQYIIQLIKWIEKHIKQNLNNIWKVIDIMKSIYEHSPILIEQNIEQSNYMNFFIWVSVMSTEQLSDKIKQLKNDQNELSMSYENSLRQSEAPLQKSSESLPNKTTVEEEAQENYDNWEDNDTQFLSL